MKRRYVEPAGGKESSFEVTAQDPNRLMPLMEDPLPETRDMSEEQRRAFIPPDTEEERVERSKGDQGRT